MTNSISCPVCQNLCSSQASSCPKCGHPFIQKNESEGTAKSPVFLVIFKILAYFSLIVGIVFGLSLIYGLFFNLDGLMARGWKNLLLFLGGMIFYAFFSFLISVGKRK